jgi:uncharacterized membrane protein
LKLHFQERPWDLYVAGGYVAILGGLILALGQGLIVAILMVIFVPGYVLVAALFPDNEEIDWIERIALSFGLSIAVVPLIGLLLNFTPFGIRLQPIVVSIMIFSEGLAVLAYYRRMQLPVEKRLSATIEIKRPAWHEYSGLDKVLSVGLVASVVFSASVLAYVVTTPRPGERFTEFYILGPEGMAADYPTDLNVSEPGTIIIGVNNHEFETVNYTVRVDLVGVEIVYNESGGFNETVELNSTTIAWFNFTLDHDTNWTMVYTFSIDTPGLWKVRLLLFRDGDLNTVYRNLHLFVRVGGS